MPLSTGFSLGRIAGIEIVVDWSLLIIFLLITFSLAIGVFPVWHPEWSLGLVWLTAVAAAVLFFASVLLHELSHALVGRAGGIEVRRIMLFMFGGMAQMENEPRSWKAEFAMAIVGPITSVVLGIVFLSLAGATAGPIEFDPENPQQAFAALDPITSLLLWLGPVNILLGLFNLVPGFPLDGGRVLRSIMWGITGDHLRATRWASALGQGFAWILIAAGFAMILGLQVPIFGSGLVGGLWLVLIGWFLNSAAMQSYLQLLTRQSLEEIPVSRLMQTHFTRIAPYMSVSVLIDEYLMPSGQRAFPVEENGRLVGMVCLRDLSRRERGAWENATVKDIMTPASSLMTVPARCEAFEALTLMGRHNVNQLPVVEGDKLLGLIRREDVLKWLFLYGNEKFTREERLSQLS